MIIELRNDKAFGIIELMVGIILSGILILTAGTMLYYHYRSWYQSHSAVDLHRDATIAMDMISRAVRPVRGSAITEPASGAIGTALKVSNKRFYFSQNSLWYSINGNEIEVIGNNVSSISFTKDDPPHCVKIEMTLDNGLESITMNSVIKYRI